ncbi:MAG: hypothetical protein JSS66_08990 [Armatimonadetes bacterium]|nr:hypothetical protein [Armatimonadota bacterium]
MTSLSKTMALALASVLTASAFAAPFTPGNIVISRVGDGSGALTSAATAVFLDEYTPAGVLVQSVAMPIVDNGNNQMLTSSGTATSEGYISRSTDGNFIVIAGYDAAVGTAAVAGTASATINRVVGRVAADGTVDTTTAFDAFNTNNPRSVASVDGTAFWLGGAGSGSGVSATGGARYVLFGPGNTTTLLTSDVTNMRNVKILGGQLYYSSMSGAFRGVNTVGVGLPTTSGQTTTLLPGFDPSTTSPQSTYDYAFGDANTLYVADDRAVGGGLQKWTFDGSVWTLQYTIPSGVPANDGIRGLIVVPDQNGNVIYATTDQASGNNLVTLTDSGSGSTFTVLATAPALTRFRGLCFTPAASDTLETLAPNAQQVVLGQISSGDLASLAADDNNAERMCRFILPNRSSPFVVTNLTYTTSKTVLSALAMRVKAKMSLVGQFGIALALKDQTQANVFDTVLPETSIGTGYATFTGNASGSLAKYLGGGGAIVGQIRVRNTGPVPGSGNWCTDFEFAQLDVTGH